jgi:cytochrome c oxidase subunit 3
MTLRSSLTARPWTPTAREELPVSSRLAIPTARLGLFVFMVVVTVLFTLLASAYLMRMTMPDWRPLSEPPVLWANSMFLLLSSLALYVTSVAFRRGRPKVAIGGFLVGVALAIAFLVGQMLAWWQLGTLGYYLASNPANTFFYVLTTLHGLHLVGGLLALGWAAVRLGDGANPMAARQSLDLCVLYWHFLLLIWVGLFALLLADNDGAIVMPGMNHTM